MTPDGQLVSLRRQEGSLIYSDDQGRSEVRAINFISLTRFLGRTGEEPVMFCWRSEGEISGIAEAIALLYTNSPGLKDAVDGLYTMIQKRTGRSG